MSVRYDSRAQEFIVDSDECDDCGQPLYFSGCDAPSCSGWCCMDCATGCDLALIGDEGSCAAAIAAESGGARKARLGAEREAWGLPGP